jgi:hypothetical protein
MPRRFDEQPTNASRALQIWLILIGAAHDRRTLTYGGLAKMLGFKGAGTLAHPLGHLMHYCRQNGLPPLTVLVVNQATGLPGEGLTETDLNADREAVFEFDWYALVPPAPEELGAVYREASGSRGEAEPPYGEVVSEVRAADDVPEEERTPNSGDDVDAEPEDEAVPATRTLESVGARAASRAPWRVAKCLLMLRDQVNRKAPNRKKTSDGTIGDAAHASRSSDHNPWVKDGGVGVVTAVDVTHDPAGGCDANAIAEAIRSSRDRRVKYIIWNRRIANSSPQGGQPAWAWRPYRGQNPHTKHIHISVKPDKPSYDSTAAWSI